MRRGCAQRRRRQAIRWFPASAAPSCTRRCTAWRNWGAIPPPIRYAAPTPITAIGNQVNGGRLGYLNSAFYKIRQTKPNYGPSFNDITTGDNSVIESDIDGNDVVVSGFAAGDAWDATTGIGSPKSAGLVDRLIHFTSAGDGVAAIATSKPHNHGKPPVPGSMGPH